MKIQVISTSPTAKTLELKSVVFESTLSPVLLAQAVRVYRARLRQGTSKTKTRSEINRTHKKWFKQKGTGNARHGARTPSIFVGGGVAHGPNGIQNWSLELPPQMKRQALSIALTAQAANVMMLEKTDSKVKAKALRQAMVKATGTYRVLVILPATDMNLIKMIRNLATVMVQTAGRVNALDISLADKIVLTDGALAQLEARVAKAAKTADRTVADKEIKVAAQLVATNKAVAKKAAAKRRAPKAKVAKPVSAKTVTKAKSVKAAK